MLSMLQKDELLSFIKKNGITFPDYHDGDNDGAFIHLWQNIENGSEVEFDYMNYVYEISSA